MGGFLNQAIHVYLLCYILNTYCTNFNCCQIVLCLNNNKITSIICLGEKNKYQLATHKYLVLPTQMLFSGLGYPNKVYSLFITHNSCLKCNINVLSFISVNKSIKYSNSCLL